MSNFTIYKPGLYYKPGLRRASEFGDSTLGTVVLEEERLVTRLIEERLDVDWVVDGEDLRWDAGEVEEHAEALREFQRLNEELYAVMRKASLRFQHFLEAAGTELGPYGIEVMVQDAKLLSEDPDEWVSPEFFVSVVVKDLESNLFFQPTEGFLRFLVDMRLPVAITEKTHDVSFMAYSARDTQLTPGNMVIQALYPETHFEEEDFEVWRETRLGKLND